MCHVAAVFHRPVNFRRRNAIRPRRPPGLAPGDDQGRPPIGPPHAAPAAGRRIMFGPPFRWRRPAGAAHRHHSRRPSGRPEHHSTLIFRVVRTTIRRFLVFQQEIDFQTHITRHLAIIYSCEHGWRNFQPLVSTAIACDETQELIFSRSDPKPADIEPAGWFLIRVSG